jgi:glycosyltransferase involved in cell wall biosynthesis
MGNTRVLHVIYSLQGGGAETQLRLLLAQSRKYNIDSLVFCVDKTGYFSADGIDLFSFDRSGKYDLSAYKKLWDIVSNLKPDVIHAWLPAAMTIPAMIIGWLKRKPVIFSYRNKMFFHRPVSYPEYLSALFFCKKIVSNNLVEQSIRPFRFLFRLKNGEVVYNAVENIGKNVSRGTLQGKRRLIFVGRLTRQKNVKLIIDALDLLDEREDWLMDIFGEGELEALLKSHVQRRGLDGRIMFRGFCADIRREMSKSDLLIFPSIYEGMPNVLVEAMASGLPVIASDIPASRDVVKGIDCVEWIDPYDKVKLSKAIKLFLDDPQPFFMRAKNGLEIVKRFSVSSMAKQYADIYKGLV